MKRALIGGFISLVGSVGMWGIIFIAASNLTSAWSTPPGRFITTLLELDILPWFLISAFLVGLGLALMAVEFFKADK